MFAASKNRAALLFGQLIIMVVYLPIFAPDRRRGEDVPPDGLHRRDGTLIGAMILSVTFIPAAVALFIGAGSQPRTENDADACGQALVRPCWIA